MAEKYFTYGPANVNELLTLCQSVIAKSAQFLSDAVFNRITLFNALNKRSLVRSQGGASILVPILYAKNTTFKAYTGDEVLDTQGMNGLTMAQLWA